MLLSDRAYRLLRFYPPVGIIVGRRVFGDTGGRDSRIVLAAALQAGFDFTAATEGTDDDPDVVIGRLLCDMVGVPHESFVRTEGPHLGRQADLERAAHVIDLICSGTASLGDAQSLPLAPPREGPLILWHSGHGGEPGRAYWGLGEDRDGLVQAWETTPLPGRLR